MPLKLILLFLTLVSMLTNIHRFYNKISVDIQTCPLTKFKTNVKHKLFYYMSKADFLKKKEE